MLSIIWINYGWINNLIKTWRMKKNLQKKKPWKCHQTLWMKRNANDQSTNDESSYKSSLIGKKWEKLMILHAKNPFSNSFETSSLSFQYVLPLNARPCLEKIYFPIIALTLIPSKTSDGLDQRLFNFLCLKSNSSFFYIPCSFDDP
jgi:hypothetical protein